MVILCADVQLGQRLVRGQVRKCARVHALMRLNRRSYLDLVLEQGHVIVDALEVNLAALDPLLRVLNLLLQLRDLDILRLALHPAQVNSSLDLGIVLFTLLNPVLLLRDAERQLVSLEFVLSDLLVQTSALLSYTLISLRLLLRDLLYTPLTSLDSKLGFRERSQYVRRNRVDVQLGLARQAHNAVVLLPILRVQLRERKDLEDTVCASEGRTELALCDLFAFELGLGLATHSTSVLRHERRLQLHTLRFECLLVDVTERKYVLLSVKRIPVVIRTDSDHRLPAVEFVILVDLRHLFLHLLLELVLKGVLVLDQRNDALIDI